MSSRLTGMRWVMRSIPVPGHFDVAERRPILQREITWELGDGSGYSVWEDVPTTNEATGDQPGDEK
jgi:hypothetical protein